MKLERPDGHHVAYEHAGGATPGILFLGGFKSNMQGDKALFLDAWCRDSGRQFTRFDYLGHGHSTGLFEEGTIGRWIEDALVVLDTVTQGPQVLVGSSMGGWIMLQLALARPERLQLELSGSCLIENCYDDGEAYTISSELLDEGDRHRLLDRDSIPLDVPVRLLHGQRDPDVCWKRSLVLAEKLRSDDVEIQLIKAGDHRLSRPQDLERLRRTLESLLGDSG